MVAVTDAEDQEAAHLSHIQGEERTRIAIEEEDPAHQKAQDPDLAQRTERKTRSAMRRKKGRALKVPRKMTGMENAQKIAVMISRTNQSPDPNRNRDLNRDRNLLVKILY